MKKLIRILIMILCFVFVIKTKFNSYALDDTLLKTSDGFEFSMDEVVLYESDFYDKDFSNNQEVYDYIFDIGYNRIETASYIESYDYLTDDEKDLVKKHPIYAAIGFNCATKAREKAAELYEEDASDGKIGNAFNHAYWVSLMFYKTEPSFAIAEAYARENYSSNDSTNKYMDIYNDDVAYNFCTTVNEPSEEEILKNAISLVDEGKLIYIISNFRYLSQITFYEATGEEEYTYAYGTFYSYTNKSEPWQTIEPKYVVVRRNPSGPNVLI